MTRIPASLPLVLVLALAPGTTLASAPPARVQDDAELERLLAEERRDASESMRRGDLRAARRILDEHLDDDPADADSRTLRAQLQRRRGAWDRALEDAQQALLDAQGSRELVAAAGRTLASLLVELGRSDEALEVLEGIRPRLSPEADARDAWILGSTHWVTGGREEARELLRLGVQGELGATWERLLARARCERRLGYLEQASRTLVEALRAPGERGDAPAAEADVLAELASVYFEADAEIDHAEARGRSPQRLYQRALEQCPGHEGALLGQFAMRQVNWNLQSRSAETILDEIFAVNPASIGGLVAAGLADLEDGRLVSARQRLGRLSELAPGRRDVRALEATLAWIEHRRDEAERLLATLATEDALDATPEVTVGHTLNELYRFGEALEFLRRATERDPRDAGAWTQLGRSLANTGDSLAALEALDRAIELDAGRQNAWRHNTHMVLERMKERFTTLAVEGDLSFSWEPSGAEVLAAYEVPFYQAAREELADRYGFTPGPVNIQVFDRFQDFSVRSTGFEGFPALGVCFGPVVTAVSPISELRGKFSWARTSFHEFTHVVHLGLSHNRCPRWITEGLATWEEERKNPAWSRNMRRDLVDALANDQLIPVRELNRAFRGPRILFGYYQGGLLCRMLIDEHGFQPMIRLLEAFDRGLDVDRAFDEVFATSPEEVDADFRAFVQRELGDISIEPRWNARTVARMSLQLPAQPPQDPAELAAWAESWTTVAWGWWQAGRQVDAEQALRRVDLTDRTPPRAMFLRGEMALSGGAPERAAEFFRLGLDAGGSDFRVHMALGRMALNDNDLEAARAQFELAEAAFPGYPETGLAAELFLAEVHGRAGETEAMHRARERWLAWNADEYAMRIELARWHAGAERAAEAERWYAESNEIDPFRRALHEEWGDVLSQLARHGEALREYRVAVAVPAEVDLDQPGPLSDEERAGLLAKQAGALLELGRATEAGFLVARALALDPDCALAKRLEERGP